MWFNLLGSNDKLAFGYMSGNIAELYNCNVLPCKK